MKTKREARKTTIENKKRSKKNNKWKQREKQEKKNWKQKEKQEKKNWKQKEKQEKKNWKQKDKRKPLIVFEYAFNGSLNMILNSTRSEYERKGNQLSDISIKEEMKNEFAEGFG